MSVRSAERIGISNFDHDPVSAGGLIFPSEPFSQMVGPSGPGGASPITGWTGEGFPFLPADHTIDLDTKFPMKADPRAGHVAPRRHHGGGAWLGSLEATEPGSARQVNELGERQ
jgi:hypothetical protein